MQGITCAKSLNRYTLGCSVEVWKYLAPTSPESKAGGLDIVGNSTARDALVTIMSPYVSHLHGEEPLSGLLASEHGEMGKRRKIHAVRVF